MTEFSNTTSNSSNGNKICRKNVKRPLFLRKEFSSYISNVTLHEAIGNNIRCNKCSLKFEHYFIQYLTIYFSYLTLRQIKS